MEGRHAQEDPVFFPYPILPSLPQASASAAPDDRPDFPTKHDNPRPETKHDRGEKPNEKHPPIVTDDPPSQSDTEEKRPENR